MRKIFIFFLLTFLYAYGEGLKIVSDYPLPYNNLQEIYNKTKDINLIVELLKKTDDFLKIYVKGNTVYLKRKLYVKDVTIHGNRSFWRREILAITGLIEGSSIDPKILHNIYIRLKKFYMDNGFPFAQVSVKADIDEEGNVYITLDIDEGGEKDINSFRIYTSVPVSEEFKKKMIKAIGIEKGDMFNLSAITAGLDRLQKFLYENDYYDSFVNLVNFRPSGRNKVDIILFADLGMKYNIHFSGNKFFNEKQLKKQLTFAQNGFNYYQIVQSTKNIENLYRENGFLDVMVIPSYKEYFEENRTDIFFSIYEGDRYKVAEIKINSDTEGLSNFFEKIKGQFYKKEKILDFLKQLKEKYYKEGYLNVHYSIKEQVKKENKTVLLNITFNKGKKFVIKSIQVKNFSYKPRIKLPMPYDPHKILVLLDKVKSKLKDEGYFDGDAFLDVKMKPSDGFIESTVIINVKKGVRYKQGITFIYGTRHLYPKMLMNNLSHDEYYSKKDFDNELDFMYYTSLFDAINPYLRVDKKRKEVDKAYILHEDKRGSFQGSFGYNSEQKLKLTAALNLKNLFKYGFETSAYVERNDLGWYYRFTFGNRLLPKRTGLFLSYLKNYEYHSIFDLETQGFELKAQRKPNRWVEQTISLQYMRNKLKNQNIYPDDSFKTLKIMFAFTDDHKRPDTNPRQGYFLTGALTKEFRDINYFKIYTTGRYYLSYSFLTWTQKISFGHVFKKNNQLPPSERFFLGGVSSFRGFGYEDIAGKNGQGGNTLLLINNEVRYPIFPSFNLFGFTFVDVGNVYEDFDQIGSRFRKTAGTGVYMPTPVGSFLLDVAFKLDRKSGESLYRIEFSINTLF
ncbi:POTRA domain-containing protein [Persephonella sp.]|nr:POTRA domain-containing protein [Persephonella sp.]